MPGTDVRLGATRRLAGRACTYGKWTTDPGANRPKLLSPTCDVGGADVGWAGTRRGGPGGVTLEPDVLHQHSKVPSCSPHPPLLPHIHPTPAAHQAAASLAHAMQIRHSHLQRAASTAKKRKKKEGGGKEDACGSKRACLGAQISSFACAQDPSMPLALPMVCAGSQVPSSLNPQPQALNVIPKHSTLNSKP
eukprot:388454-Rhodomonas_salina.3